MLQLLCSPFDFCLQQCTGLLGELAAPHNILEETENLCFFYAAIYALMLTDWYCGGFHGGGRRQHGRCFHVRWLCGAKEFLIVSVVVIVQQLILQHGIWQLNVIVVVCLLLGWLVVSLQEGKCNENAGLTRIEEENYILWWCQLWWRWLGCVACWQMSCCGGGCCCWSGCCCGCCGDQ